MAKLNTVNENCIWYKLPIVNGQKVLQVTNTDVTVSIAVRVVRVTYSTAVKQEGEEKCEEAVHYSVSLMQRTDHP